MKEFDYTTPIGLNWAAKKHFYKTIAKSNKNIDRRGQRLLGS